MGLPLTLDGKPKVVRLKTPKLCPKCRRVVSEFDVVYEGDKGKLVCPKCEEEVKGISNDDIHK